MDVNPICLRKAQRSIWTQYEKAGKTEWLLIPEGKGSVPGLGHLIYSRSSKLHVNFVEGESEFVSGFNVEYGGGGGFALIFLAGYASILFKSLLFCIIF